VNDGPQATVAKLKLPKEPDSTQHTCILGGIRRRKAASEEISKDGKRVEMKIADDGVLQFTVPMPMALREVHVYALETDEGWVLIDSGFPSIEARDLLTTELQTSIGGLSRVSTIIVTHFHPDHSGLAGWIQERSNCNVVIHQADWPRLENMAEPESKGAEMFSAMAMQSGVTFESMRALFREVDVPIRAPTLAVGNEVLMVGGRELELIWTPGHTEGHLCVMDRRSGAMFTGDHLLARITPHVGRFHSAGRNPLHDFEDSLALVERLAPRRALPAHEGPIEDVAVRCREIAEHHQARREQVLAEIRVRPQTAQEIAALIFRGREGGMHEMLALSETEAHLDALVEEGLLVRLGDETTPEPSYELCARPG
jgi:glyoxylase-like metal-dependent hydrolase (beta-lactamase superfamily II)